ncbi:hypothetical protein HPB49_000065 [Dermacentor silvarum]|uniref:Uncharacterized protein n=1 Tax=Dermacentor silvarum TaxID=543639 RepID=A0ACB8CIH1_DERSI|nr:hypothetical protein HPB49_000065 [Dermacentor silvarum]
MFYGHFYVDRVSHLAKAAFNKRGGSAATEAPGARFGTHCGGTMTMEVTVEVTEITPEELKSADWITKVGKHVKELQDLARDERRESQNNGERAERGAESGEGKKAAAANAALALAKVPTTRLSAAVRMAAQIAWVKGQEKEMLIVNDKQGTLIFSTPDMDTVWKVTKSKSIKIEDKDYEVTAYLAPHQDNGRCVVHGIDPRLTIEELTEAFGNPRNPPILGVRKMGNSS